MNWWIVLIALALAASPFYAFLIAKAAGAGWVSGVRSYIKLTFERKRTDG